MKHTAHKTGEDTYEYRGYTIQKCEGTEHYGRERKYHYWLVIEPDGSCNIQEDTMRECKMGVDCILDRS